VGHPQLVSVRAIKKSGFIIVVGEVGHPLTDMELADLWAIRYYEWSLQQAQDEFRSGFPLLSHVLGCSAFKVIEYAGTLDALRREKIPAALVKRFNARAMALLGDTLSPVELKLVNGYLSHDKKVDAQGTVLGMFPYASEKQRIFNERIDSGVARRGKRQIIRKMVTEQLAETLGSPISDSSGTVKYENNANGWRLRTIVDYGGSYGQISYGHVLIPEGLGPLFPPIHLCGWMGLAGETRWDLYTSGQEGEVAASIVQLVSWFVERWVPLTDSLDKTSEPGGWPTAPTRS
jgi:hypothetical protein